jgi:hypothetical protein
MKSLLFFVPLSVALAQPPPPGEVFFQAALPAPSIGAAHTFGFVAGEMLGGAPVKGAPYSANAVTETVQTLADGNRIANRTSSSIYRDSQGRERREQTLPSIGPFSPAGQEAPKMIFISDPVAGVNYSLDPVNKTAIKLPAPPQGAPMSISSSEAGIAGGPKLFTQRQGAVAVAGSITTLAAPAPQMMVFRSANSASGNAPTVEQLGSKVVEGVSADGTRTTFVIAAGQIGNEQPIKVIDEQWRSSELQVTVQSEHSDPRMGTTTYSLQNVSRSEPAITLFQVPPDYTVKDSPAMNFQKVIKQP